MRIARFAMVAAAGAATALAVYSKFVRPWHVRWGTTDDEFSRGMPLDERVRDATIASTRAITIDAPPEQIWPWIVQMGDRPRGGYYSYAWIERMQGMSIESADRILTEYQSLQVGDTIDKNGTIAVQYIEPGRALVLGTPDSVEGLCCTWAFALFPIDTHATRLITRVRAKISYPQLLRGSPPYIWPFLLLLDPGVFVMERKMLREIKRHAELHGAIEERSHERPGRATQSSGSGKTTLLTMLGGLLRPTSGSILLEGTNITKLSDRELAPVRRNSVGFIFQSLNLSGRR
jgi:hypothetical protein